MSTLEILMKAYPGRVLLTVHETAQACGLAPGTIRTRLSRKTFPVAHRKMGDKTLFHIEEIREVHRSAPYCREAGARAAAEG